jgi:hypothetical protein
MFTKLILKIKDTAVAYKTIGLHESDYSDTSVITTN